MKIKGRCGYHNVDLVTDSALSDEVRFTNGVVEVDLRGLFVCPALTEDEEEDDDIVDKCYVSYTFTISPEETLPPHAQDIPVPPIRLVETL